MWQLTGRCLAPPITTSMLGEWESLPTQLAPLEQNAFVSLRDLVLRAQQEARIPEGLPPMAVLNWWQELFEGLSGPARQAAFHLLWYVKELALGRHPDLPRS